LKYLPWAAGVKRYEWASFQLVKLGCVTFPFVCLYRPFVIGEQACLSVYRWAVMCVLSLQRCHQS